MRGFPDTILSLTPTRLGTDVIRKDGVLAHFGFLATGGEVVEAGELERQPEAA